jgi:hypothetical protein
VFQGERFPAINTILRRLAAGVEPREAGEKLLAGQSVKSLRIRSFVTVTRHDGLKLGCVQMEGVPALGEPGLADPTAFQHAVREASSGAAAHVHNVFA